MLYHAIPWSIGMSCYLHAIIRYSWPVALSAGSPAANLGASGRFESEMFSSANDDHMGVTWVSHGCC